MERPIIALYSRRHRAPSEVLALDEKIVAVKKKTKECFAPVRQLAIHLIKFSCAKIDPHCTD